MRTSAQHALLKSVVVVHPGSLEGLVQLGHLLAHLGVQVHLQAGWSCGLPLHERPGHGQQQQRQQGR